MPHPDWGVFPDTVLRFPAAGFQIDLRRGLEPGDRRALAAHGLGGPFAVVTASNPLGRVLDSAANRRLGALFAAAVRERHPEARPADGCSPDGRHVEPGWAIPGPLEDARRLAARFFQAALFWYDGSGFRIVPVLALGAPLPLPPPLEATR